jgi:hypothetical protein
METQRVGMVVEREQHVGVELAPQHLATFDKPIDRTSASSSAFFCSNFKK